MSERRPIPGLPGYEADDLGQIWKVTGRQQFAFTPHVLTPHLHDHGYLTVRIFLATRGITKTVHSLVARAFHGDKPLGAEVRHVDGNKQNNRPTNLQWGATKQNTADRVSHGRLKTPAGRGHRRPDVTPEVVALLHAQGLSTNQIAKRLNVWQGTVRQRLQEAGLR